MKYTFTIYYRNVDFYENGPTDWHDDPSVKRINAKNEKEAREKFKKRFPDKVIVCVE